METKYWIDVDTYEIKEVFAYNLSPKDKREVKKSIYLNLDYVIEQWNSFYGKK